MHRRPPLLPGLSTTGLSLTVVALAGVLLAGCSDEQDPVVGAGLQASTAPSSAASASAAPSPSADPRSPAQLATQLAFTSAATTTPAQKAAVESYRQFVEAYVVAEGIPDPDYPPLLARASAAVEELSAQTIQSSLDDGEYVRGPYREQVLDVGQGPQVIALLSCSDIGSRRAYDQATDTEKPLSSSAPPPRLKLAVTMTAVQDGYEVTAVTVPEESSC